MKFPPLLFVLVLALQATASTTTTRTSAQSRDGQQLLRGGRGGQDDDGYFNSNNGDESMRELPTENRRQLVLNGTPTGGQKYPFLVVARRWSEDEMQLLPFCHGVMVTNDVILLPIDCTYDYYDDLAVGDYNKSNNNSIQIRSRVYCDDYYDYCEHQDPSGSLLLRKIKAVTLPGFFPVTLDTNRLGPIPGQNLTLVGYGSITNFLDDNVFDNATFPGEALETSLQVTEYCDLDEDAAKLLFCAKGFETNAGPCWGERGTPLLGLNNSLMGLTSYYLCGDTYFSGFFRIPQFANWIRGKTCRLTDDKSVPFCPDLVCPQREKLYYQRKVPNATRRFNPVIADRNRRILTFNGFEPVKFTQEPSAGSALSFDTATSITVSAVDAKKRTLSCTWKVEPAPPVQVVAWNYFDIENGTYQTKGLRLSAGYGYESALVYGMTATLDHKHHAGNETVVKISLLKDDRKYGPLVQLTRSQPKVTQSFKNAFRFNVAYEEDEWRGSVVPEIPGLIIFVDGFEIQVEVRNNKRPNAVYFRLTGQPIE